MSLTSEQEELKTSKGKGENSQGVVEEKTVLPLKTNQLSPGRKLVPMERLAGNLD